MTSEVRSSADLIAGVLRKFGLERVHVAACMSGDWSELVARHASSIHSLTIVAPHLNAGTPSNLKQFPAPTLIIAGAEGDPATRAQNLAAQFNHCELFELAGYTSPIWADTIADRTTEVHEALSGFLARTDPQGITTATNLPPGNGQIDGVHYEILGHGPPLLLLPLSLSPSQWDPLIPLLQDHYCTISLGGRFLGAVSLLEDRAATGYGRLVAQVTDQTNLVAGETVLEVGCGSGALARGLAKRTNQQNPVTATDINRYLLKEAKRLTAQEGLGRAIHFEEADAAALPYPDDRFDAVICCTVLEEGDADKMVSELARVTKPGGRVVTMTRAIDADWVVNVPVAGTLAAKLNALGSKTGAGVGSGGCADASLYGRMVNTGLAPHMMGPLFALYTAGERLNTVLNRLGSMLDSDEGAQFQEAIAHADRNKSLFVGEPFHCFVGVKPIRSV